MSVLIRIKRTEGTAHPTDLKKGELGISIGSGKLYVGTSDSTHNAKLVGEGTFLKLAGGTMTGALKVGKPEDPSDVANKQYVDDVAAGLDVKESVVAVAKSNISMSEGQKIGTGIFEYTDVTPFLIDDVIIASGMRILLAEQDDVHQNGIFDVKYGSNESISLTRSADTSGERFTSGAFTFVERGTVYGGTGWVCTLEEPFTEGGTRVYVNQFSGGGSISLLDLSDTPDTYGTAGQALMSTGTGLEFGDIRSTFIELTDTPASYSNSAGKIVTSNGSSLVFTSVDTAPATSHTSIPIASSWAYKHDTATYGVHGVPASETILHSGSTIDGGTWS